MFLTEQGSPATRYRRAVETRSILLAELAAREMSWVPLKDALGLLALYAELGDRKYERAAVRWLVRLAAEKPELQLRDLQLAVGALQAMPDRVDVALNVLTDLSR